MVLILSTTYFLLKIILLYFFLGAYLVCLLLVNAFVFYVILGYD